MIETDVIAFLRRKTSAGDDVYAERPESAPDRYIVIEKTGGGASNRIKRATMAIQSIAPSMAEAASLNEEVKEVMEYLPVLGSVSACRLNTDYNFTDTETKEYRYQAVFDITHY